MKLLFCLLSIFATSTILWAQSVQTPSQTEEVNKALVLRFYEEVWNKGNVAVVDEVFAANYLPHDSTAIGPLEVESSEEQKKIALYNREAFTDFSFVPQFVIAEGDKVVGRWTLRGRTKGILKLISANPIEVSGVNIFRFENGKVVEIWNHRDDLGAHQQIGFPKLRVLFGFIIGLVVCSILWLSLKLIRRMRKATA
ncbi:MAG: ester cyclase [Acidobacteriota bacterium]